MKKYFILLVTCCALGGCVGLSGTDGDSTKRWVVLSSSKADMSGDVFDVCFRLDLRFTPQEAIHRIDTDKSCITRCCWFSENKTVELRFNDGFTDEYLRNGKANKYDQESITFHMRYSPFLNTIHAKAEPSSAVRSDGLVALTYNEVRDEDRLLKIDFGETKAQSFDDVTEENTNKGEYIFRRSEEGVKVEKTRAVKAKEAAAVAAKARKEEAKAAAESEDKETLLARKLAYERQQAVLLLRRFYNKDIDAYIMSIDKAQKKKGLVLLANDRNWATKKTGSPIYRVTCSVNGELGKTKDEMRPYPIGCGVYEVDLDEKTVKPLDTVAASIVSKEYKH